MIGAYRLKKFYNRRFGSRFVINTLPKSGTNLLGKAVGSFAGVQRLPAANMDQDAVRDHQTEDESAPGIVPVGVGSPVYVPVTVIEDALAILQAGDYARWHVPYSDTLRDSLLRMEIKMVVMMRDPRDVVISQAKYVRSYKPHRLYDLYQSLSEDECILQSINGVAPTAEHNGLVDIDTRCRSITGWRDWPNVLWVTFEELVGPEGGGTEADQHDALRRIAHHLGFWGRGGEIARIAEQLYGGTRTFRKGQIGGWRERFTPAHKAAFKAVAGSLLVELGYEQGNEW
jgi:hypothetical protein